MDGQDWRATNWATDAGCDGNLLIDLDSRFVSGTFRYVDDAVIRRERIAGLVAASLASVAAGSPCRAAGDSL